MTIEHVGYQIEGLNAQRERRANSRQDKLVGAVSAHDRVNPERRKRVGRPERMAS
jgi:hypothetical protein